MQDPPLCGACRTRPCKRKRGPDDAPLYYEWCASCRQLANLDVLEAQLDALDAARRRQISGSGRAPVSPPKE